MRAILLALSALLLHVCAFSQPVITSLSRTSGPIGSVVTINGTGFNANDAGNAVYFGAVKANILLADDTSFKVTVPAGATYQPVTVTTNNRTAYSPLPFNVTFSQTNEPFDGNSFLPKQNIETGIYPHSISVADFNNDGKSDLLVCKGSSSYVSILQNTSTGNAISFDTPIEYGVPGVSHECAATGDLDGDGKLDFVVTNTFNSNTISVFRNTTAGSYITFDAPVNYPADNAPYSVAIGDLDNDGRPDIAIANGGSAVINIYRNTSTPGVISFASAVNYTVQAAPYSIAIGDLNADGKADLAVTTQTGSSGIHTLKNNSDSGTIAFAAPVPLGPIGGPYVVSIGDFNNDGKPDLAVASGYMNVFTNITANAGDDPAFDTYQSFPASNYPVCIAIADLNGDGKPDMASSNRANNNVTVNRNTSSGGSISFTNNIDYAAETDPYFIAAGDLDGDGRPDLAVANAASSVISILRNITGANISPVINSFTPATGVKGTVVTIKGLNFTGATSVKFGGVEAASFTVDSTTGITATVGAGASGDVSVTTALGTDTAAGFTFTGPIISSFAPAVGVAGTVVTITGSNFTGATAVKFGNTPAASFNIVSATTINAVIGTGSSGNVSVTTAQGEAILAGFSYAPPSTITFSPLSGAIGTTVTIAGSNFSTTASDNIVYFGAVKATVSAATATELKVTVPAGATYQPVTVTSNNLTAYSSLPFTITFTAADRMITSSSFTKSDDFGTGDYPFAVALADLNNDGKADIITANGNETTISVLKNKSNEDTVDFESKINFTVGTTPRRLATGDLDGDGKLDVVVSNFNSGNASTISVLRNTSTSAISLATKTDFNSGNGTIGVAIGDMDQDGKPDIVTASGNSGFFSFFKNTSTGTGNISFAARQDYSVSSHGTDLILADVNNDGKQDIIISQFSGGSIAVFINASTAGSFYHAGEMSFATGSNPTYMSAGDIDYDKVMDLVTTNYSSGNVSVLQSNATGGGYGVKTKTDYNLAATNTAMSDLNGDGKPDMVAGIFLSGNISVLENRTDSAQAVSLADPVHFTTGTYDTYVTAGDLNGDGKPEIVVANTTTNTVTVLNNQIGAPVISGLSPNSGYKGDTIIITGGDFTGATAVIFGNEAAASFEVVDAATVKAVVARGSSGIITVTTPSGKAKSAAFTFIPGITLTGDSVFCAGGSVVLTSTAKNNNQWYKNGVAINAANGETLQATLAGIYTVSTSSNGITSASTDSVKLETIEVPKPAITKGAAKELVSSASTGNQWYFNGDIIAGAVNKAFLPDKSGAYSVKVSVDGCSSEFSDVFQYVTNGVINLGNDQFIAAYPNPVQGELHINWEADNVATLDISISTLQGKQLLAFKNVQNGSSIDISQIPDGLYAVTFYSNGPNKINKTTKIVKGK